MLGKDFYVFWQFGLSILQGQGFYSSPEALYPPAIVFFFVPLALIPFEVAYALWTGLNGILFYTASKKLTSKKPWVWFLFSPTIFILMTGQIDIIFLWLSTFLNDKNSWKQIIAATPTTLKPQLAFVLLPWWLIKWIQQEPKQFGVWVAACLGLHGLPLLFDFQIYAKWLYAISDYTESRIVLSPGLFSLSSVGIPVGMISIVVLPILYFGFRGAFPRSKAASLLALPMGIWYDSVLLTGSLSWKMLIPTSWVSFVLAVLLQSSIPFLLMPLVVFLSFIKYPQEKTA